MLAWRDESAGHLGKVVAKVGRQTDVGDFTLGLLAGRSRLVGNGLTPLYTFDEDGVRAPDLGGIDRAAVDTHPDLTRKRLGQASLSWRHALDARTTVEALA